MPAREIVDSASDFIAGLNVTLQLELIYCGKCKQCPHGPYWYAYWKVEDPRTGALTRTVSAYIGKDREKARVAIAKVRAARKKNRR